MTPPVPVTEEQISRASRLIFGAYRRKLARERAWRPADGVAGIADIPTLTPIDDSGLADSIEACERMAREVEAGR